MNSSRRTDTAGNQDTSRNIAGWQLAYSLQNWLEFRNKRAAVASGMASSMQHPGAKWLGDEAI
jgi:hypothetical protein